MREKDIIIIGSGPAGLTAAIYAARANLKPLVFEGYQAGGQLMITTEVENFPGFSQGIKGPELMVEWRQQAERFGAELVMADVTKVKLEADKKQIWQDEELYLAKAVIIATGAAANYLGLESENRLKGRGVSACATCDGFFFQDKIVAVIGGGDSAMEEASYLTHYATKVYIVHRRDQFRASKIMIDRVKSNPKVEFVLNAAVVDVLGQEQVTGIRLKNIQKGDEFILKVDGMFVAIGHTPKTNLFKGQLDIDDKGYIVTAGKKNQMTATSIPGVFACGDVQDSFYRQAVTAAGSGCMAAIDCERYLDSLK